MIGVDARGRSPRGPTSRASERECWIALSLVPGVGPAGFAQLVHRLGSAAGAWREGPSSLAAIGRVPAQAASVFTDLAAIGPRDIARSLAARTGAAGGRIVTDLDDDYPPALRTLDPRPPVLYLAGDGAVLESRAVAIVGTRRASGYGLATAVELGAELSAAGIVVVSGLALGIDGAAQRATVGAGRSIAVLPSPLDRIYPPRHRGLARDLVRAGGALMTEIPVGASIGRPDFARRNRLIAGLAEATIVVEAPDRSGALLTAAAASAIGREVYAVPGPIDAMTSRGCNRLIADNQAVIVTSAGALLRQIGVARGAEPPAVGALSEVEGQVLRRLLERSGSIEELVDRTGHPPASVASALTLLEARGLVNPFGGATFHPTLAAKRLARLV